MSSSAKGRMERILHLLTEIDEIKTVIREVYAEEKADGGDKTAMGAAIAIIRKREKDPADFAQKSESVDVYLSAYNGPPRAHTHTPARTREAEEFTNAQRPSNRDVSADDEPSSGAGPQAEAPLAGTGSETLAGHEGNRGRSGANAGRDVRVVPLPIAKPSWSDIDLTIPAFLDRRIPKRDAAEAQK